jgi:hypothetical protein
VVFGEARTGFVLQNIQTDSGAVFTLVSDSSSGTFLTAPAGQLNDPTSTNKSSWQPSLEIGLAVKLVEGMQLYFSYLINSYQDVVILPSNITIPDSPNQAPEGVSAVYNTHDLQYEGGVFGFNYQW